ncbi:MAG TPA: aminoglycoside phosphotransferase family protein [Candidatus Dormibacteraeota bacterium]|nr:aminoglycoside phosphotransferase family protein [Candidatus Dormibacteraeota bacterium]
MAGGFSGPIPAQLDRLKATERGREWLDALPRAVHESAAHWRLRLGDPYPYAFTSLAIPARREDGSDVVLKVQHVDRETEHEALALSHWNGDGAIRLLDEYPARTALLLERCIPGTPLPPEHGLEVLEGLLPRLWKPASAPPFRTLAEEASHWSAGLRARRSVNPRLIDAALDAIASLAESQRDPVLLHQDLHGWNVLAAQREPWLVIDPKPLVGEREFGLAPIIRSTELGAGRRETIRRLDRLTSELGLDRERARLWCVAQTVAWSVGENSIPEHVAVVEWLMES